MENEHPTSFEGLPMHRRELQQFEVSKYRVYSDAKTFTVVEASSALQAMEASGVKTAYKVMREDPLAANLIDNSVLEMIMAKPADGEKPEEATVPSSPA